MPLQGLITRLYSTAYVFRYSATFHQPFIHLYTRSGAPGLLVGATYSSTDQTNQPTPLASISQVE